MKNLNSFIEFNWKAFAEGKTFLVTGISEYQDFDTKAHLGTKVECVIIEDNTHYKTKGGEAVSNRYEKITFKVAKDVNIPVDSKVVPVNAVASIYGEFRNQLSVKCDSIQIVNPVIQKEK